MYARMLAEKVPFSFSQTNIPAITKHIVLAVDQKIIVRLIIDCAISYIRTYANYTQFNQIYVKYYCEDLFEDFWSVVWSF